ncbi:MAG TPA: hypothetical protein VF584_26725 [Longimicrobium sp.]
MTNGEYHRLLPTLPDAALCDHAEVYAQHCAAEALRADHTLPEAYLHHFILPELVARLRGSHARELSPPDPSSIFRWLLTDWDAFAARVAGAIAALAPAALADAAATARAAVECRWSPDDLVYDGTIFHTILPGSPGDWTKHPPSARPAPAGPARAGTVDVAGVRAGRSRTGRSGTGRAARFAHVSRRAMQNRRIRTGGQVYCAGETLVPPTAPAVSFSCAIP